MPVATRTRNYSEPRAETDKPPVKKTKHAGRGRPKKLAVEDDKKSGPSPVSEKVENETPVNESGPSPVNETEEKLSSEEANKIEEPVEETKSDETKSDERVKEADEPEKDSDEIKEGGKCPDFELPLHDGEILSLKDFAKKTLVLYFYPKDNTPGCTTEAKGFAQKIEDFEKKGATIVGVSGDTSKAHLAFIEKCSLGFKLATDKDFAFGKQLGIKPKAKRQTFLIVDGIFKKIWRKVTVKTHAEDVLAEL